MSGRGGSITPAATDIACCNYYKYHRPSYSAEVVRKFKFLYLYSFLIKCQIKFISPTKKNIKMIKPRETMQEKLSQNDFIQCFLIFFKRMTNFLRKLNNKNLWTHSQ